MLKKLKAVVPERYPSRPWQSDCVHTIVEVRSAKTNRLDGLFQALWGHVGWAPEELIVHLPKPPLILRAFAYLGRRVRILVQALKRKMAKGQNRPTGIHVRTPELRQRLARKDTAVWTLKVRILDDADRRCTICGFRKF